MSSAVRTRRTVLEFALENLRSDTGGSPNNYGVQAQEADFEQMVVYNTFNVLQPEIEVIPISRAKDGLDPDGVGTGFAFYRLAGTTYLSGGSAPDSPPSYAKLIEICGFNRTTNAGTNVTYLPAKGDDTPDSEVHESATIRTYYNSWMHQARGCRGNLVIRGEAGQLVECNFDIQGLYDCARAVANPPGIANPGFPPRFCDVEFSINPLTAGIACDTPLPGEPPPPPPTAVTTPLGLIIPALKRFELNLGAQVGPRRDANAEDCIRELGIWNEFQPRWNVTIEVERGYDFVEGMKQKILYALEIKLKDPPTGMMWHIIAPTAQITRPPNYTDEDNGLRSYDIEFTPTGADNDFLSIVHEPIS